MMRRYRNFDEMQQLDPVRDHERIVQLIAAWEFPGDLTFGFNLSFVKALCVPRMAKLFFKTGHLQYRSQKRYDDTIIIAEGLCRWGHDSELGKQALGRMNFIHSGFPIANIDFLFVLASLIFEPIQWLNRYGWRKLCQQEELGLFYFWREVGKRMHIKDIPETSPDLARFYDDYQNRYFRPSEEGAQLVQSVLKLFLGWYPAFSRPVLRPALMTMLDSRTRGVLGLPDPPGILSQPVEVLFRNKVRFKRLLPLRSHQQPGSFVDAPTRTYPQGYNLSEIGAPAQPE